MSVKLAYWNTRGLAQPIRLLLKYTGTEFEDVRYQRGDAPEYSREKWLSVKHTLGLDFPNLPYLIDGEIKITQSNAILRYIAAKHNLCGKTPLEIIRVNIMENEAMDFRNKFVALTYDNMESFKSKMPEYISSTETKLKSFSKFLGNNPWFVGNEITFVDFVMYELLDQHRMFNAKLLDGLDNLKAFLDRFEALPTIKEYMASPQFMRYPVNNKNASWAGVDPNGK